MRAVMARKPLILMLIAGAMALAACGEDGGGDDGNNAVNNDVNNDSPNNDVNNTPNNDVNNDAPSVAYDFEGRTGQGSVSYDGQIARQVLIEDLKAYIGVIDDQIDRGLFQPTDDGEVVAALDFYFRFDSDANGQETPFLSTQPEALQKTYDDISSGKDLVGKLAGNDAVTDHKDWKTAFSGWSDPTITQFGGTLDSPEGLLQAFFETIEENAIARSEGTLRTGPDGQTLPSHVTESGLDLQQLTQKFLLGAVNFSQGADDYLDDDIDGKGLLSDHSALEEGEPFTALEHAWDEGFGYFGAARNYDEYTDDEIAGEGGRIEFANGYHDTNGDGAIDLLSEYNFGASTNAAKRDRGASAQAPTDFSLDAFGAFVAGRALLDATDGPLSADALAQLKVHRDEAIFAWEAALAATAVHYINETLVLMSTFGTEQYDFLTHAKVWSELKGFSLAFQFNPRSPLSDDDFGLLHAFIGDAPVLPGAEEGEINAYRANLLEARTILGDAYDFDPANLGDDNGEGGW